MDVKNVFSLWKFILRSVYGTTTRLCGPNTSNLVYRLKKVLYSLKQGPRTWLNKIGQYLVTNEFQTSNADFSLYVKKITHGIVVIVICVDDLIIRRNSDVDILDFKKLLKQKFEMKILGVALFLQDTEVIQYPKGISLLQRQ
jgi:hypothetical protein